MTEKITELISNGDIMHRITELADEINRDYTDEEVSLVCILKGGVFFMIELAKRLSVDVKLDFMDISSYGEGMVSSGNIKINMDLENSVEGKNVILVEDIIDTGRTLSHTVAHLRSQSPKSLKVCTLLDKPDRRVVEDVTPEYVGFIIPDKFVVGFGLDYAQRYRNLPYIGVLSFE